MLLLRPEFLKTVRYDKSKVPQSMGFTMMFMMGTCGVIFKILTGKSFLALPYNFSLQLNVDWFQPYECTIHSEGVYF